MVALFILNSGNEIKDELKHCSSEASGKQGCFQHRAQSVRKGQKTPSFHLLDIHDRRGYEYIMSSEDAF